MFRGLGAKFPRRLGPGMRLLTLHLEPPGLPRLVLSVLTVSAFFLFTLRSAMRLGRGVMRSGERRIWRRRALARLRTGITPTWNLIATRSVI